MQYYGGGRGTKGQAHRKDSVIPEGQGRFRLEDGGYWGKGGRKVSIGHVLDR